MRILSRCIKFTSGNKTTNKEKKMKTVILSIVSLIALSAHAYDPKTSYQVASCKGELDGQKREVSIFRDLLDKSKATILYGKLSAQSIAFQNTLFTGATAARVENSLEVKHEKMNISIDLASEKVDKTMSGKWDNQVDLVCRIITPIVD